jgi:hypothetical protein
MATQDFAASVQGVSIRVTRLDAAGNLLNGAGDSYTTSAFMRVSFTPEYEEGDEIVEKSADGTICVSYKAPDTMKRITMELAICEPDSELTALISGGLLLRKNFGTFAAPDNKSVGWSAPSVGDDPTGNGVSLEVWSFAVKDGRRAASLPYFHWVFPYARLRQSGDRVIENGMLATTFEGYGLGNVLFSDGLDGRWEWPTSTERSYSYARASWAPQGLKGFYTWHKNLAASVTTKARTSDIATLTTDAPHLFEVGQTVVVADVDAGLDGTYTISAVPANNQFRYTKSGSDIPTAPVSPVGTAVRQAGYTLVDDIAGEESTTFNVPGMPEFNPDLPIDFIVPSDEDPEA